MIDINDDSPRYERMGTHNRSKRRKFARAAWRVWGRTRNPRAKHDNDRPPRELYLSWVRGED